MSAKDLVANGKLKNGAINVARTGTPFFTGTACVLLWQLLEKMDRAIELLIILNAKIP